MTGFEEPYSPPNFTISRQRRAMLCSAIRKLVNLARSLLGVHLRNPTLAAFDASSATVRVFGDAFGGTGLATMHITDGTTDHRDPPTRLVISLVMSRTPPVREHWCLYKTFLALRAGITVAGQVGHVGCAGTGVGL